MPSAESEQDKPEEQEENPREQIQQQPQLLPYAALAPEEEPASSALLKPKERELPPIPSLRRNRLGLILGLVIGGLTLFLLGGAVVLLIVYWPPSWSEALEQLDSDFSGSWPVPDRHGIDFPEDRTLTLHVAAVVNDDTADTVYGKAHMLTDSGSSAITGGQEGDRMTILVTPVRDPQAYARKIDFGTVRRVYGRTISVVAHKVEGPPADADTVTKALHYLKSPTSHRRIEAAQRLKMIPPNERREEVARALQEALAKEHNFFHREEILAALAAWGTKASVPALLNALAEESNPFTRRALFNALARFKDERACEPLALHLEDFADRHEAAAALRAMGPIAEKAVRKRLQHHDHWVRQEVCNILGAIGTKESLAELAKATTDGEGFVSEAAQAAIQAIKVRQKAAK